MGGIARSLKSAELRQLRWTRAVSLLEGVTLVILVFVAVPLKHLVGIDAATATMGPIHGVAFLLYIWTLAYTASFFGWRKREVLRLFLFAAVPLGAVANERWLKQKQAEWAFSKETDRRDGLSLA